MSFPRRRFAPVQLGGVTLWLDGQNRRGLWTTSGRGTNVSTSGDPVGAADDWAAVGGNAVQSSAAARPTWSTSVFPGGAIAFDSVDDFLVGPSLLSGTSGSARSVFVAMKLNAFAGIGAVVANRISTRYHAMLTGTQFVGNNGVDAAQNVQTSSTIGPAQTSKCVMSWAWAGTGIAPTVHLNGTQLTVNAGVQGAESGGVGYFVGKNSSPQFFNGHIAELIWIDRAVSVSERQTLTAYLKSKHGTA